MKNHLSAAAVVGSLVIGLGLAGGGRAAWSATGCVDWLDDLEDTSGNCLTDRTIDRFLGLASFAWGEDRFLVLNTGNDLTLYEVSGNPLHPIPRTSSGFGVPNVGDSDYDLMSFSVCDDCRYGVANYKAGMVVFDLGVGDLPAFVDATYFPGVTTALGSLMFRVSGRELLLANGAPDACPGDDATLYELRDTGHGPELIRESCPHVDGVALKVVGGLAVTRADRTVLWVGDDAARVTLLEVTAPGGTVILTPVDAGVEVRADLSRGNGLAWDPDAGLLASAWLTSGVVLWNVEDPAHPRRLWRDPDLLANRVALDWPVLWTGRLGTVYASMTRDISNPLAPVLLDESVWDPGLSWNGHLCERDYDGLLSPQGGALYLARYSVAQVFDVAACTPVPGMLLFADGFSDGTTGAWSGVAP